MADTLNTPYTILKPFAENGDKNDIPETVDPDLGLMSQDVGFPPITAKPIYEGGVAPNRRDFNGAFNILAQHNFFMQNGGTYTFNQDLSDAIGGYPAGIILSYKPTTGSPYLVQSLIDNNTNNFVLNPALIDGVHWKKINATAEELDNYVNLTSNQNIDGIKTFSKQILQKNNEKDTAPIQIIDTGLETNTIIPTELRARGFRFYANDLSFLGDLLITKNTNGITTTSIRAGTTVNGNLVINNIGCSIDANGNIATYAPNPPSASNDTSIATTSWVRSNVGGGIPVGTILPYGGTTAPTGFLLCNGGAISRTTYANLFSVIGTAYGAGDGNTTFNLPNGNNRYLGGNNRGYASESLPNIKGVVSCMQLGNSPVPSGAFVNGGDMMAAASHGSVHAPRLAGFNASLSSPTYQDNTKVKPDTLYSNFIIKY